MPASRRDAQEKSAKAKTTSASANVKLNLMVFGLDKKKSRRFPARPYVKDGRLATGLSLLKEKERPGVRPEHLYARRSKGCKATSTGRSPDSEMQN
jgi:hypothetical protein